jgi:hypothetical protein
MKGASVGRSPFPENFRITHELIAEIRDDLVLNGLGRWSNVDIEMQDDGRSILITLEVPENLSDEVLHEYKTILMSAIGPRMPEEIDGLGSWCVSIRREGEMIDAVDSLNYWYEQLRKQM